MKKKQLAALLLAAVFFTTLAGAEGETSPAEPEQLPAPAAEEQTPPQAAEQPTGDETPAEDWNTVYSGILERLGGADTPDAIRGQLEAIGQLAALTGDTALQSYAECRLQILDMEAQLAQYQGLLQETLSAVPRLAELEQALVYSMETDVTLAELLAVLPEGAGTLLAAAGVESVPEYSLCWLELKALVASEVGGAEELVSALGEDALCYIALRLLALAQENGLLPVNDETAGCIERLVDRLAAAESAYLPGELAELNAASLRFAGCGKLASGVSADRLIVRGGGVRLQYAPIAYNGVLLLDAEDMAVLLGGAVKTWPGRDSLALQAGKLVVELEKGSGTAYLNDAQTELAAPVLVFEGRTYVSAELLPLARGKDCLVFSGVACLIL